MSSAAAMAARSALRSTVARATISGRLTNGARLKSTRSPFGMPKQNPLSQSSRIFRSPVEMSCCVESLLPYHSATASALLTSMLSVSRRSYGWTCEAGYAPMDPKDYRVQLKRVSGRRQRGFPVFGFIRHRQVPVLDREIAHG